MLNHTALFNLFSHVTVVAVVVTASGCGVREQRSVEIKKGASKLLKPKDLYRYVGKGKAKRKASISIKERRKLLFEASKKIKD
jgi:hypothetical protein